MVSGDTSCLIYIIVLLFYSFTFFGLLDICGGNKVSRMMMMMMIIMTIIIII